MRSASAARNAARSCASCSMRSPRRKAAHIAFAASPSQCAGAVRSKPPSSRRQRRVGVLLGHHPFHRHRGIDDGDMAGCYAPRPLPSRRSRSARITCVLSPCSRPRVASCRRRARSTKLSPSGRNAASRIARCSASADLSLRFARCFSRRTNSSSNSRTRSVAIPLVPYAIANDSINVHRLTIQWPWLRL